MPKAKPPHAPPAPATAEAPLRINLWPNRGKAARYRPEEWVVLRLATSAPCFAALYRVAPSGSVTEALAPAEKPAWSYGLALKAGEDGTGEEWAITVASVRPLSPTETAALVRASQQPPAAAAALRAALAYLQDRAQEEPAAPKLEPWQYAVAVTRYEVTEPPPGDNTAPPTNSPSPRGTDGNGTADERR